MRLFFSCWWDHAWGCPPWVTPFVVEATADGLIMSLIRSAGSCVGRGDNDDDDDDDDDDEAGRWRCSRH